MAAQCVPYYPYDFICIGVVHMGLCTCHILRPSKHSDNGRRDEEVTRNGPLSLEMRISHSVHKGCLKETSLGKSQGRTQPGRVRGESSSGGQSNILKQHHARPHKTHSASP